MSVSEDFSRRIEADRLSAAVLKAVRENNTDALRELGINGYGDYVQRLSELMSDSVRRELAGSDDFAELMRQLNSPARYAHHLVNEAGTAVQQAKDTPIGIHIRPAEPEFSDERLKSIVGEAAESDGDHSAENLAVQLGTFVKSMGNDFMQANAEQRSRAGFKVMVERSGGSDCCPWCADRIGKWELKDAPDGVFGVHDNCTCMINYTTSTGTATQGRAVHGKWYWTEVQYEPPHRLTAEEAAARGSFLQLHRLTGGANGGIIYADGSTAKYPPLSVVPKLNYFRDSRLNQVVTNAAQDIMNELKKQERITEAGFVISITPPYKRSDIILGMTDRDGVILPKCTELGMNIHNHPSGDTFSSNDIDRFVIDKNAKYMCVIGNNGKWYVLEKENGFDYIDFYKKAEDIGELDGFAKTILQGAEKYGFKYYEA